MWNSYNARCKNMVSFDRNGWGKIVYCIANTIRKLIQKTKTKNKQMYPKNFQEYVANAVIKHNKYRDDEIAELEAILADLNVDKCKKCQKYKKEMNMCGTCDADYCTSCSNTEMKSFTSSDTYDEVTDEGFSPLQFDLCNKCSSNLCTSCNSTLCKDCTNRILPNL